MGTSGLAHYDVELKGLTFEVLGLTRHEVCTIAVEKYKTQTGDLTKPIVLRDQCKLKKISSLDWSIRHPENPSSEAPTDD